MEIDTSRPGTSISHIVSLLKNSLPLAEESVCVCFDAERYRRKTNTAQEDSIASQWRRRCRKNPRLYNGSKFRYAGIQWPTSSRPQIQLGLTSYKDHIGTNCGDGAALLQQAGETVHGDRQAFLADPLGVGAIVLTSDNRLVLVKRALWTGEYPGCVDRPGGHAEPDELFRDVQDDAKRAMIREDEDQNEAVQREVFESIRREIRDELGVPMQHLSRPYLMGALRDEATGGRPTLEFVLRCSLPSSDLQRLYNEGKHAEADESLGLVLFTKDELFGERAVFQVPDLSQVSHEDPLVSNRAVSEPVEARCGVNSECWQSDGECTKDVEGAARCADRSVAEVPTTNGPTADSVGVKDNEMIPDETSADASVMSSGAPVTSPSEPPTSASTVPPLSKSQKRRRRNRRDKQRPASATANKLSVANKVEHSVSKINDLQLGTPDGDGSEVKPAEAALQGSLPSDKEEHASGSAVTLMVTATDGEEVASAPAQVSRTTSTGAAAAEVVPEAARVVADVTMGTSEAPIAANPTFAAGSSTTEPSVPHAAVGSSTDAAASQPVSPDRAAGATSNVSDLVVVHHNGVVLFQTDGQVIETAMPPPAATSSGKIETLAEVNNPNPEAAEQAAAEEKTPEEVERERKGKLWDEMTPSCRAAIVLLKQLNLKGFVFRF